MVVICNLAIKHPILVKSQIRWEAALTPDKEAKVGQIFPFSFFYSQLDIPTWILNLEE